MVSLSGFATVDNLPTKDRIIMAIEGEEKKGKTHFALTAPGPTAVFNFDNGLEGVVNKFKGKEVLVKDFKIPENPLQKDTTPIWEDFAKSYKEAINHPQIKSIVIDSWGDVWDLLRLVRFGKLSGIMPQHYISVNSEMEGIIRQAYGSNKNLILVQKLTPEWVDGKATKNLSAEGYKKTPFAVQVNARLYKNAEGQFVCLVKDCRQNHAIAGMEFVNSTFEDVQAFVLGG